MNSIAIALVIPPFAGRGDTYAVDYGRVLGADWMARATGWYAPAVEFVVVIENDEVDDYAVRVVAANESQATDRVWAWADRLGFPAKDVWTSGTRAQVEDSWGDQGDLPLVD